MELREGQIWKENDKRITRHIEIVQTLIGGRAVRIRTCSEDGGDIPGARTTETSVDRFVHRGNSGFSYVSG